MYVLHCAPFPWYTYGKHTPLLGEKDYSYIPTDDEIQLHKNIYKQLVNDEITIEQVMDMNIIVFKFDGFHELNMRSIDMDKLHNFIAICKHEDKLRFCKYFDYIPLYYTMKPPNVHDDVHIASVIHKQRLDHYIDNINDMYEPHSSNIYWCYKVFNGDRDATACREAADIVAMAIYYAENYILFRQHINHIIYMVDMAPYKKDLIIPFNNLDFVATIQELDIDESINIPSDSRYVLMEHQCKAIYNIIWAELPMDRLYDLCLIMDDRYEPIYFVSRMLKTLLRQLIINYSDKYEYFVSILRMIQEKKIYLPDIKWNELIQEARNEELQLHAEALELYIPTFTDVYPSN